ncbi:AraC family transcriptional regulator [Streptomyces omiyaensis]|uniref:helix-turn-helix transcriptional regulator n=2 Tax=Streptomyces omiyaensis TaxID=68247 RepID=UPI0016725AA7|nr:AraC family transcriptional regulator [Streptomyces omiyaensis]GGY40563.1 AraC family transcriptional regulator [Streptomyces omiyaensis]
MADRMTQTTDEDLITATGHPTHAHDYHQLLYAPLGRITVTTPDGEHELTSPLALWLPAGTPHSARFDPESLVLAESFDPALHRLPFARTTAVHLDGAARRHLLARTRGEGAEVDDAVMFAALTCARNHRDARLPLPRPTSEAARAVAGTLLRSPDDQRTATEWAESLYVSATSLRRAFRAETGIAFSEWRTRVRLNHSLALLSRGHQVGAVAAKVGFTSTNGYILAFRRHFGRTPGVWIKEHEGRSPAPSGRARSAPSARKPVAGE